MSTPISSALVREEAREWRKIFKMAAELARIGQLAEKHWRKLEATGRAYEFGERSIAIGSFREGYRAAADELDRLRAENEAMRAALETAENALRHGLMMEPCDPFKRGKIISEGLDVVRAAIKQARKEGA